MAGLGTKAHTSKLVLRSIPEPDHTGKNQLGYMGAGRRWYEGILEVGGSISGHGEHGTGGGSGPGWNWHYSTCHILTSFSVGQLYMRHPRFPSGL